MRWLGQNHDMKHPDYVAIKKPGDDFYTWYDKNTFPERPPNYSEDDKKLVQSVNYQATGKLITRDDGEIAEVWEALP